MTEVALGLSREYDDFVIGMAGHLWAVIVSLMRDPDASAYGARCLRRNLQKLGTCATFAVLPTAVWLAHVAAAIGDEDSFEFARREINERGGIAEAFLYEPPRALTVSIGDEEWPDEIQLEPVLVPVMKDFLTGVRRNVGEPEEDAVLLEAIRLLLDTQYLFAGSASLLAALHKSSGGQSG
jgi:hypothetical protein